MSYYVHFHYFFFYSFICFNSVMLNTSHKVTQGTGHYHFPRMIQAIHLLRCFQHSLETKHLGVTVDCQVSMSLNFLTVTDELFADYLCSGFKKNSTSTQVFSLTMPNQTHLRTVWACNNCACQTSVSLCSYQYIEFGDIV